jgi:alkaline phosphatase
MIGIDIDGNPAPSILELVKSLGKSTSLVSDVRLTHATRAAFAAHQPQVFFCLY